MQFREVALVGSKAKINVFNFFFIPTEWQRRGLMGREEKMSKTTLILVNWYGNHATTRNLVIYLG